MLIRVKNKVEIIIRLHRLLTKVSKIKQKKRKRKYFLRNENCLIPSWLWVNQMIKGLFGYLNKMNRDRWLEAYIFWKTTDIYILT